MTRLRASKYLILLAVGAGLLGMLGYLWKHAVATANQPPQIVSSIKDFVPYYADASATEGFSLAENSAKYQAGVLVFTLKNNQNSKTLIVTEQKLPPTYDTSSLRGDQEFRTMYGQAFITDGASRTTGALFSDDKTWVLINTPTPIGGDAMHKILASLKPTR